MRSTRSSNSSRSPSSSVLVMSRAAAAASVRRPAGLLGGGAPSSCHRGGAGSLSGGWRRSVLCLAAGRSSGAARLAVGRGASSSSSSSSHMGRGVDRCWGTGARWGLSGALSRRGDGAGAGSAAFHSSSKVGICTVGSSGSSSFTGGKYSSPSSKSPGSGSSSSLASRAGCSLRGRRGFSGALSRRGGTGSSCRSLGAVRRTPGSPWGALACRGGSSCFSRISRRMSSTL